MHSFLHLSLTKDNYHYVNEHYANQHYANQYYAYEQYAKEHYANEFFFVNTGLSCKGNVWVV